MNKKRLNHKQVVKLHKKGMSYKEIGLALDCHPKTVSRIIRQFTEKKQVDKSKIREMRMQGIPVKDIAKMTNLSVTSIYHIVRDLSVNFSEAETDAREYAIESAVMPQYTYRYINGLQISAAKRKGVMSLNDAKKFFGLVFTLIVYNTTTQEGKVVQKKGYRLKYDKLKMLVHFDKLNELREEALMIIDEFERRFL